jgi:hypothetical protein
MTLRITFKRGAYRDAHTVTYDNVSDFLVQPMGPEWLHEIENGHFTWVTFNSEGTTLGSLCRWTFASHEIERLEAV